MECQYCKFGKELFYTRVGQLDMSCGSGRGNYGVDCADHLSQGQIMVFLHTDLKMLNLILFMQDLKVV